MIARNSRDYLDVYQPRTVPLQTLEVDIYSELSTYRGTIVRQIGKFEKCPERSGEDECLSLRGLHRCKL